MSNSIERCKSTQMPDGGLQCGLPAGHTGAHTILIPTGAPWFPKLAADTDREPKP